jgi:hypothetical protein
VIDSIGGKAIRVREGGGPEDILASLALSIASLQRIPTPLALAVRFHQTYERLAPSFCYETRQDTREFDPQSKNGRLVIAVCAELGGDVPPNGDRSTLGAIQLALNTFDHDADALRVANEIAETMRWWRLSQTKTADQLATEDAMSYGSGFVRVMPNGSREYVPHHEVFIEPASFDANGSPVSQSDSTEIAGILRKQADETAALCEDCPPVGYPTDKTRCTPCPRRVVAETGAGR